MNCAHPSAPNMRNNKESVEKAQLVGDNCLVMVSVSIDCHPNTRAGYKPLGWGRGWDLNPGKRLHRPIGYQATSPRPLFGNLRLLVMLSPSLWVLIFGEALRRGVGCWLNVAVWYFLFLLSLLALATYPSLIYRANLPLSAGFYLRLFWRLIAAKSPILTYPS